MRYEGCSSVVSAFVAVGLMIGVVAAPVPVFAQDVVKDLFSQLRGKWGGTGIMALSENRKSRIICNAEYSGSASQLVLAINCDSDFEDIKLRARLSRSMGRLSGSWQEEGYNAVGAITGSASDSRLSFRIGGGVNGKMVVDYNARRQTVLIETLGIPLEKIEINMQRR